MRRTREILRAVMSSALLLCLTTPSFAGRLPADLLGLHPGMTDIEARQRLSKIGEVIRGKEMAKQTWKLRDPRFEYLVIRFDADWRLHWVTAFAREGGKRARYRDVGDLASATHTGQHFYTWTIPARGAPGTWTVVARGGDPQYLESLSMLPSAMRQALIVPAAASTSSTTDED
jgi:hypothetical protein